MSEKTRLIFHNLVNGVPLIQVARDFQISENEALQEFSFVLRKIKSYCFLRKWPPILAVTIDDAKRNKMACLRILPNLNLEKPPAFKDIQNEIVKPENFSAVSKNLNT